MIRSLENDESGSVITVFAFSAMVLAVLTAIVVNQISFYMGKRKLQAAVDMASLIMMQSSNVESAHAVELIKDQLGRLDGVEVAVTRGRFTPDATMMAASRFVPAATPFNAIQVDAWIPATPMMMAGMLPQDMSLAATARAARRQTTSIAVGSRLVRVEGGLSAALLDSTLGYKGKLTVMDYNALASAHVDAVQFLQMLNVKADLDAVTFEDVLNSSVKVGDVISALAMTTDSSAAISLLAKASPASGAKSFRLGSVMQLGSIAGLPLDALTAGAAFPLSVGEVLGGSVALADSDHQVALNLAAVLGDASIADVALSLGEKPQVLRYDGFAEPGSEVSTSQLKLSVGALGTTALNMLKVDVALASAKVKIAGIECRIDGTADVTLKATTEAASVGVKALFLPKLSVKLGSDEEKELRFSPDDIANQTYKPVRSGLGLQVGPLTLTQVLLVKPVDALLEKLGLHIAEADVKVMDANCGSAGLVF